MLKFLIGGSPCTHWSIAQSKNRETTAEGIGWELFKNYLIAKQKFNPDFFLYENNKSAAPAIKEQIAIELGYPLQHINSALVSAQNRQRFYCHNFGLVPQPSDRGILLRDILESGDAFGVNSDEKSYCLTANYYKGSTPESTLAKCERSQAAEPVEVEYEQLTFEAIRIGTIENTAKNPESRQYRAYSQEGKSVTLCGNGGGTGAKTGLYAVALNENDSGKARPVDAHYAKLETDTWYKRVYSPNPAKQQHDYIAEPIRVGCLPNANGEVTGSQSKRIYSVDGKSVPILACSNAGGASDLSSSRTGLYAEPVVAGVGYRNRREADGKLYRRFESHGEEKANALTSVQTDSVVAEPYGEATIVKGCRLRGREGGPQWEARGDDKANVLDAIGARSGTIIETYTEKIIVPTGAAEQVVGRKANADGEYDRTYELRPDQKSNCITQSMRTASICENAETSKRDKPVYTVEGGRITIKGKQYPIKLPDGLYIIRKLSVTECCRLQTMPDDYCRAVSATQGYKGLGNGWTAEVIMHLLSHALRGVPKDEEIVVLSMYDGIGTGRYCFDKLGYKNIRYYAYEIDKYAMQIAMSNYPDIIERGDAFQLRADDWQLDKVIAQEFRKEAVLCG